MGEIVVEADDTAPNESVLAAPYSYSTMSVTFAVCDTEAEVVVTVTV